MTVFSRAEASFNDLGCNHRYKCGSDAIHHFCTYLLCAMNCAGDSKMSQAKPCPPCSAWGRLQWLNSHSEGWRDKVRGHQDICSSLVAQRTSCSWPLCSHWNAGPTSPREEGRSREALKVKSLSHV